MSITERDERFLTSTDAARLAKVSDQAIRDWVKAGKLACSYTANGIRLFRREDVIAAAKTKRRRKHAETAK